MLHLSLIIQRIQNYICNNLPSGFPNLIIFINRGNLCVKLVIYNIGGSTFQRSRESPEVCTVSAATTCLGEYMSRTPAKSIHVIVN